MKPCTETIGSRCPRCGSPKQPPFFKSMRSVYCLACARIMMTEWRRRNKGEEKKITAKYRDKMREVLRLRQIEQRKKPGFNEKRKARYRRDPQKYKDAVRARAQRVKGRPGYGYTTPKLIEWRIDYWGRKCWRCGGPYEAVDHVKPISKGGSHWPANLRPICTSCNGSKRDKWPI